VTRARAARVPAVPWRGRASVRVGAGTVIVVSERSDRRGAALGLLAAATFGVSVPIAKRIGADADPQQLAGVLYLGAALSLGTARWLRPSRGEAPLRRADLPVLAMVTATGGVIAPVLLLVGLQQTSGVAGSLLLNLEGPCTVVLAVAVFGEHLGGRALLGGVSILAGGALLGLDRSGGGTTATGVALIVMACAMWAVDNNLTQRLTDRDPLQLVTVKAAGAAALNLAMAWARGADLPSSGLLCAALALGGVSYGLSVLLDAHALRLLGAAREAAWFATAPFAGAITAVAVFGEPVRGLELAALGMMAAGVVALLADDHDHLHDHAVLEHDHRHVHDAHHHHHHEAWDPMGEPHAHRHRHAAFAHRHAHTADRHHRHGHA
jgi:drug/metabolite transporter (DMT)-like permease